VGIEIIYLLGYLLLGAFAGLLAGLLGVGGGLIIVPMLTILFEAQNLPHDYIVHLAIASSLATIVFTSISSVRAHHAHDAVDWNILKKITPGIIFGTGTGTIFAARLTSFFLNAFLIIFLLYAAFQMLLDVKPKPTRVLPGRLVMFGVGSFIGGISSLVGIGGGSMSVPFLIWCNQPVPRSIGTSAAIGFPIAIAGALGYLINGLGVHGLPTYSIGFIYLPAFVCIALASMITAPVGARLAHRLPVQSLKKGFGVLLLVIASKMIYGAIS